MATPIDWPRGPAGPWLSGNLDQYRRDPLGFLTDCARRYGDFVPLRFGPVRAVLLSHPNLIEEVLVTKNRHFVKHGALRFARLLLGDGLLTSEGEAWRRRRRLVQPAFHRERIACHAEAMVAAAERMMDGWGDGQALDAHADMTHLAFEVAATCLFGADLAADAAPVAAAVDLLQRYFSWRLSRFLAVPLFVPTPYHLRIWRAGLRLLLTVRRMTAGRRAATTGRDDLSRCSWTLVATTAGSAMTGRQVREEAMTLLLAGHETTANTLAWGWYLLAQNPDAEARLHEEVDRVLGGRPPAFHDVPRLEYAGAIIAEALRVYPPAYAIGRQAASPCEIGGYPVPRGTTLLMSQWVVHRDSRFFVAPEEFLPERWAGDLARIPAAVRLLPVRGRAARLRRQLVRADRGDARARGRRAAVPPGPAARPRRPPASDDDTAPCERSRGRRHSPHPDRRGAPPARHTGSGRAILGMPGSLRRDAVRSRTRR